jgi:lathosterol oxidase
MSDQLAATSFPQLVVYVSALFAISSLALCTFAFGLERLPIPRIWNLPLDAGQLRHELIGNAVFVALTSACFVAALSSGAVRFATPSALTNGVTFLGLMIGFQIYYYALHRSLHTRALLRFHRWHHVSRVTTPLSAQSMSWVETLGWAVGYVALPVIASRAVPISLEGWTAYMFINMLGNICGHANVELMPKLPAPRKFAWGANPSVYHALHHARWRGHYGFQSVFMDRLFRSEFADWPVLHAQLGQRQPLTSLRARGEGADLPTEV